MSQLWRLGLAVCLLGSVACFNKVKTVTPPAICGANGVQVSVNGTSYCAYDKGIQVTGFHCPAGLPNAIDYLSMTICSPTATVPDPTLNQIYTAVNTVTSDATTGPDSTGTPDTSTPSDLSSQPDTPPIDQSVTPDTQQGCIEINVKPCITVTQNGCCTSGPGSTVMPDCVNGQYVCPSGSVQDESQCHSESECTDSAVMLIAPTSITHVQLPTNAARPAVVGFDPERNICVMVVFEFATQSYCNKSGSGTGEITPIVMLKTAVNGSCSASDFDFFQGPRAELSAHDGCVDFKDFGQYNPQAMDLSDFSVTVKDSAFTGKIVFNNRMIKTPKPVTFTFYVNNDIPESYFAQVSTADGNPAWVRVRKKGEESYRGLFDLCCACGQAQTLVVDVTNGGFTGRISLTWDGIFRTPGSGVCNIHQPAEPGVYEAEFCLGGQLDGTPPNAIVKQPFCIKVEFSYPEANEVSYSVQGG